LQYRRENVLPERGCKNLALKNHALCAGHSYEVNRYDPEKLPKKRHTTGMTSVGQMRAILLRIGKVEVTKTRLRIPDK